MSSKPEATILALAVLSFVARAEAQAPDRTLDERGVVALVEKHNPALKAALLNTESARFGVAGLEDRYAPVLALDGSVSQIQTPNLFRDSGVSINTQRRADLGAELKKHFLWGTDISVRLAGNALKTAFEFPNVVNVTPGGGTVGPGQGGFALFGNFGPGYGVLGKLTLKQPLLRGRGRDVAEADLNVARAERTASEHARERVASEQLRDALSAYWELWYADRALAIQVAAREVASRQRRDTQARVDTGGVAPVEVLAFETQVASREEDVAVAEAERRRAQLELGRLLGSVGEGGSVTVTDDAPPAVLVSPPSVLEERALAHSAELQERAAAVGLARIRARTATEPTRQRLDLDAYVQAQGLGNKDAQAALAQLGQFEAVSAFVGLTYEAPVHNRALRAAAARARVDVEAAEQELAVARQRILTDLGKGLEQEAASQRRVELATLTATVAEKQLAAEQARFATGTATSLQVLEAEDRLRSAKLRVARAQADLVQTALSLEHMTGQLLSRFGR